jgi:energy-coupling factor transporter ATP-binding protein EcfA2
VSSRNVNRKEQVATPSEEWMLPERGVCVDERFHDPNFEIPEYRTNPLILALPPYTKAGLITAAIDRRFLKVPPANCRKWSREKKIAASAMIKRTLSTTSQCLIVIDKLYSGIRKRLANCNPFVDVQKEADDSYRETQEGRPAVIVDLGDSHADCFSIFGISGTGKTTLIKMVLSTLPPAIRFFKDSRCHFKQIVYIFVSCPHNGSLISLCEDILDWIDECLGTHYHKEMAANATSSQYTRKLIKVLRKHKVGVLVIDEIQNALRAAEKARMLDFLVNLLNANCCMLVAIGTPESKPFLRERFRLGRRFVSDGAIEMDPLAFDDEDWKKPTDAIMCLDFFPSPPKDKEALRNALSRLSAGDLAIAKLAWTLGQVRGATLTKESCITEDILVRAAEETFSTIKGMMEALRTKDHAFLSSIVDMATWAVDARIQREQRDKAVKDFYGEYNARQHQNVFLDAVQSLTSLGYPQAKVEEIVERIIRTEPELTASSLVYRVLSELHGGRAGNASGSSTRANAKGNTSAKKAGRGRAAVAPDPWVFDPSKYADPSSEG